MIGALARACDHGREDARAGRWDPPSRRGVSNAYVDAWYREKESMRALGRLPQLELPLRDRVAEDAENILEVGF
jgi:hypothetical protein